MSVRPPSIFGGADPRDLLHDTLNAEIAGEMASALGRAGRQAEKALLALARTSPEHPDRPALLKTASDAVYALFIQRELCGLRDHQPVIRDLAIPRAVLARLGAH